MDSWISNPLVAGIMAALQCLQSFPKWWVFALCPSLPSMKPPMVSMLLHMSWCPGALISIGLIPTPSLPRIPVFPNISLYEDPKDCCSMCYIYSRQYNNHCYYLLHNRGTSKHFPILAKLKPKAAFFLPHISIYFHLGELRGMVWIDRNDFPTPKYSYALILFPPGILPTAMPTRNSWEETSLCRWLFSVFWFIFVRGVDLSLSPLVPPTPYLLPFFSTPFACSLNCIPTPFHFSLLMGRRKWTTWNGRPVLAPNTLEMSPDPN